MASIQNSKKSIENDVKICNSSAIALMVNKTFSNLSKKQFLHFSLIFPGVHLVRMFTIKIVCMLFSVTELCKLKSTLTPVIN